jgi:hypothetical protein
MRTSARVMRSLVVDDCLGTGVLASRASPNHSAGALNRPTPGASVDRVDQGIRASVGKRWGMSALLPTWAPVRDPSGGSIFNSGGGLPSVPG